MSAILNLKYQEPEYIIKTNSEELKRNYNEKEKRITLEREIKSFPYIIKIKNEDTGSERVFKTIPRFFGSIYQNYKCINDREKNLRLILFSKIMREELKRLK